MFAQYKDDRTRDTEARRGESNELLQHGDGDKKEGAQGYAA